MWDLCVAGTVEYKEEQGDLCWVNMQRQGHRTSRVLDGVRGLSPSLYIDIRD